METSTLRTVDITINAGFKVVVNGFQVMSKSLHGDTSIERRTEVRKKFQTSCLRRKS
nr:MAG TPA: hypothetical protein [Caudoviricetes sp.]